MEPFSGLFAELERIKPLVWSEIQKFLPQQGPPGFTNIVNEYPSRQGKYFRPALLMLSNAAHGGDPKTALTLAAAMQLSEEWLLVHDDMEDGSDERRSTPKKFRPTLNAVYGDALAVNAGDALHVAMWQALGTAVRSLSGNLGWQAYDLLAQTLLKTIAGQHMELSWIRDRRLDITDDDYYAMADQKAGLYTVITPLQLGAISAGVYTDDKLDKLARWGLPMGRAFQIWDDCMNLTTDPAVQGKERAGDVWEGKRTLALLHLMRVATPLERDWISQVYAKPRASKSQPEIDRIVGYMESYGSIGYGEGQALLFTKQALEEFNIHSADLQEPARGVLRQAIEFVSRRKR